MDSRQFWSEQLIDYLNLAEKAMDILVSFSITYLCEIVFCE